MVGYIAVLFALGAGMTYEHYMADFGTVYAHRTMLRHLINMGVISCIEVPAKVSVKPFPFYVNLILPIRRYMSKERVNRIGILNVNVAKLI